MCPQTKRYLLNLHIKSTQYRDGQPRGIKMDWDIIQMDGRKERRQGKEKQRKKRKDRKKERKKEPDNKSRIFFEQQ
jgi:hypothetical protein